MSLLIFMNTFDFKSSLWRRDAKFDEIQNNLYFSSHHPVNRNGRNGLRHSYRDLEWLYGNINRDLRLKTREIVNFVNKAF